MANTAELRFANEEDSTRLLDTQVQYSLNPMVAGQALRFPCGYVPVGGPLILAFVLVADDDWMPGPVINDRGERLARNAACEAQRQYSDWNAHEPSSLLPPTSAMGQKQRPS